MRNAAFLFSGLILVVAQLSAQVTVARPSARVEIIVPPGEVAVAVPAGRVAISRRVGGLAVVWPAASFRVAWPPAQIAVAAPQGDWGYEDLLGSKSGSFLGVGVEEVDSARAKELKLKEERGVEIRRVDPDSPAEKAGLKEHDVVLEFSGQRVEGVESFTRMVRETPAGRSVKLVISRGGNVQSLTATIGRRKESRAFSFTIPSTPMPPMPPLPSIDLPRSMTTLRATRIGVETESLSGQLAEFFGVKEGVLVRSVERDSPAEKAGIKPGDVIVKIENERVRQPRDLSDELRNARDKKTVQLQVVRNKKEMTLNLELPERSESGRGVRVLRHDRL